MNYDDFPSLLFSQRDRVLTVTLNRPERLNAIDGQMHEDLSRVFEDINRNRDEFLEAIHNSLAPELEKIGLVLINVNITDITDESGYIEAIGRKAASEAIQQAEIDVAEQQKRGAIGVAAAEREKSVEVAIAKKEQDIGTKEAEKDREVRLLDHGLESLLGPPAVANVHPIMHERVP